MKHTDSRSDISCENSLALAVPAGHYSHVCIAAGQVFVSGQLPIRPDGTALIGRSFEEQAAQVLENIEACLSHAGVGKDSLLLVRVYVTDIEQWPVFNKLYAAWIGTHRPARAVAGVSQLHHGLAIEVEAIALAAVSDTRE